MKATHALVILASAILLCGCGSDGQVEPERLPRTGQMPSDPKMSTAPNKYATTNADLSGQLDMPVYPGSKTVLQEEDVTGNLPPDEKRFRITLTTPDPVDKVAAFFEKQMDAKAHKSGDAADIFAKTKKGNDCKLVITSSGSGSQIVETVIVYKH